MATVDVDKDIQQAIVTLWNATPGLGVPDANNNVLGPLQAGRLVPLQTEAGPPPAGGLTLYCALMVSKEGADPNQIQTYPGGTHDYRLATITVRGKEADVSAALGLILGTFNRTLGIRGFPTLVMPSGAQFMSFRPRPQDYGAKKIEDQTKKGEDVWQGQVVGQGWTGRTGT